MLNHDVPNKHLVDFVPELLGCGPKPEENEICGERDYEVDNVRETEMIEDAAVQIGRSHDGGFTLLVGEGSRGRGYG
jgi:hypothetical protein